MNKINEIRGMTVQQMHNRLASKLRTLNNRIESVSGPKKGWVYWSLITEKNRLEGRIENLKQRTCNNGHE